VDINTRLSKPNVQAAGTGIVLDPSGHVLTNNHVINGATSITVTDIGNGQTYPATVLGYDSTHDIAVLQLQGASGLATALIGDSGTVDVGEEIAAIGNAGGRGGTPSVAGGQGHRPAPDSDRQGRHRRYLSAAHRDDPGGR
jgi:S1-C subfamily serine protease